MRRHRLICLFLALGVVAVYWPVVTHEFTNYDDPAYVTQNPHVQGGFTREGVMWAFGRLAGEATYWHPLTWLSHMLDCQLFGLKAGWHHAMNLLFHAVNVVLLFVLLARMTGAVWRSAMVAALFALHPLQVDTVAWVAERKNVISTFFWLATMWAYVRYAELRKSAPRPLMPGPQGASSQPPSGIFYLLALGCFALGLMCKPMLVTLPFVLLLLDYWPLDRLPSPFTFHHALRLLREKVPLFILSAASCTITVLAHQQLKLVASTEELPVFARLANAAVSYALYLKKTIWPDDLTVCYLHPSTWPLAVSSMSILLLLAVVVGTLWQIRRRPFLFVGWFWFLGTLVPVIGLLQVGMQALADRFMYVPIIGLLLAVVWGAAEILSRAGNRIAPVVTVLLTISSTAVAAWFQVGHWQNNETLYTHALKVTSNNWLAHHNLGHDLLQRRNYSDAIAQFAAALRIRPAYPDAEYNWGNALGLQEKYAEAIPHYVAAINLRSNFPLAHFNLANALTLLGAADEAEARFLTALAQKPDYADAHLSLGNLYLLRSKHDQAEFHLRNAVKLNPDHAGGHYWLASALARQKKFAEAVPQFRTAIKLQPDYAIALNDLAWILATTDDPKTRDAPEAVRLAQRACDLTRQRDVNCLDTLAVACSEAGRFDDAAKSAAQAAQIALAAGNQEFAAQIQKREKFYREGRSYRNLPPEVQR